MSQLLKDDAGIPIPQHVTEDGSNFEQTKGRNGAMFVEVVDLDAKLTAILSAIETMDANLKSSQAAILAAINNSST